MIYIIGTGLAVSMAYMTRLASISHDFSHKQRWILVCLFSILTVSPLMLISAVRYGVGSDYFSYVHIYRAGMKRLEPAFVILNQMLHQITSDPQIFFAVTSILFCCLYFRSIFKESVSPAYSVLLFVLTKEYFRSMNGIRQMIAMAIALLSLPCLKKKNMLGTVFFIALACLFHKSAIIYVIIYAIYFVCPHPAFVAIAAASMGLWGKYVMRIIYPIIDRFTTWGHYFLSSSRYSVSDFGETVFLVYVSFFFLLCLLYKKVKRNSNMRLLYSAVTFGVLVILSGTFMPTLVGRAAWCVNAFIVLYVPETVRALPHKRDQYLVNSVIVLCYALLTSLTLILKGDQGVLPYAAFWQ